MPPGIDLGKQYGPLPLGAWIAVIGGGLAIALYSRRKEIDEATSVVVEDGSGVPGVGIGPGWIAVPPPSTAPPGPVNPTTNEDWARRAIDYLINQGYDPGESDLAIRKYLESQSLTIRQRSLVNVALRFLGSPPVPLPPPYEDESPVVQPPPPVTPPVVQPPPPPVTPTQPPPVTPAIRIHVVSPWPTRGSTLWGIAGIYYNNSNRWPEIYAANRKGTRRPDGSFGFISNPDYLRPGDRVYVP